MDRFEIVVHNDEVRIFFGDSTSRSHAETNIGHFESSSIRSLITRHGYKTTFLLDSLNQNQFVFVSCSGNNSKFSLDCIKLHLASEFDSPHLSFRFPNLFIRSNSLSELFSCESNSINITFLLIDNSNSLSNGDSCLNVISSDHSHVYLVLNSFFDLISVVLKDLTVLNELNRLSNSASDGIL